MRPFRLAGGEAAAARFAVAGAQEYRVALLPPGSQERDGPRRRAFPASLPLPSIARRYCEAPESGPIDATAALGCPLWGASALGGAAPWPPTTGRQDAGRLCWTDGRLYRSGATRGRGQRRGRGYKEQSAFQGGARFAAAAKERNRRLFSIKAARDLLLSRHGAGS